MQPAKKGRPQTKKRSPITFPLPDAVPTVVQRFDLSDPAASQYLEDHGYVVYKEVANDEELQKGYSLAWDYLESIVPDLKRDDPTTWASSQWPDPFGKGIVSGDGVGHSAFLWFCRGIPNVKKVFEKVWETEELMTSFDGFCIFRSHEYKQEWETAKGWYHLDQNAHSKPSKCCVQGFLNFLPAGPDDGGLVVIPKSHKIFNDIFTRHYPKKGGDFVVVARNQDFWKGLYVEHKLCPIKVCCEPGDFVLWDSRTIHCSTPPLTKRPLPTVGILPPRRLVAYICMTPKDRLTPQIHGNRVAAYKLGATTSHWPEDCKTPRARMNTVEYVPPPLTPEQLDLIPIIPNFESKK